VNKITRNASTSPKQHSKDTKHYHNIRVLRVATVSKCAYRQSVWSNPSMDDT